MSSQPSVPGEISSSLAGAATWLRVSIRERIRIDTRSLALFRLLAGLLIVADVLLRSRNLSFFYIDEGVVPRSLAIAAEPAAAYSVYMLVSTPQATAALFALTGLVGLALAVGYYTRVATIAAFLLVVSLDLRNPFVLSFADTLFATLLFWAIFLPLGERWSIDAAVADRPRRSSVAGIATALILAQMVTMYLVNGIHKTESPLWWSGEATVLIMGIDEITFLLGDSLRAFPEALQFGGLVWFGLLLASPLLLILRDRPRTLLVAAFAGVHLSLALTTRIGAFSYVCLAGLSLFVPVSTWRDVGRLRSRLSPNRTASADRSGRLTTARDHIVAIARLAPHPTHGLSSRLRVGLSARLPFVTPDRFTGRHALLVVIVCAGVVLGMAAAASAVGVIDEDSPGAELETGATALYEFQTDWSIFAPNPRTTDRYYVFPARTADGEVIDLRTGDELRADRPYDQLQRQHDTYRERFYMASLPDDGDDVPVADHLAEYLCETYGTADGDRLTDIDMYRVDEEITRETIDDPAGRERTERPLSMHSCTGEERSEPIVAPEEW
ncbi:HTTM domain-containing protein [Halorubrum vacuolatum]|uniref:Vitamin K-dependent gamma-carboxylase n=1 Tax=Halorubrum vacuolatum TaxID=63740 RepID=A0A238V8P5_HALVU|nr:HTTM domain-containing protein [Halorubrum vacuolatum]SNR30474.1 Vitamin K-dependent gamma-carboxylase [Halorubrum vacuolatum]